MCRNIKTLFNFDPPATEAEIRASALQYVRKVSGFRRPSRANEAQFEQAVAEVAAVTQALLDSLVTNVRPRRGQRNPRLKCIARCTCNALREGKL